MLGNRCSQGSVVGLRLSNPFSVWAIALREIASRHSGNVGFAGAGRIRNSSPTDSIIFARPGDVGPSRLRVGQGDVDSKVGRNKAGESRVNLFKPARQVFVRIPRVGARDPLRGLCGLLGI